MLLLCRCLVNDHTRSSAYCAVFFSFTHSLYRDGWRNIQNGCLVSYPHSWARIAQANFTHLFGCSVFLHSSISTKASSLVIDRFIRYCCAVGLTSSLANESVFKATIIQEARTVLNNTVCKQFIIKNKSTNLKALSIKSAYTNLYHNKITLL